MTAISSYYMLLIQFVVLMTMTRALKLSKLTLDVPDWVGGNEKECRSISTYFFRLLLLLTYNG
jgi:hypothetical protein